MKGVASAAERRNGASKEFLEVRYLGRISPLEDLTRRLAKIGKNVMTKTD
jgi:hypothetical protein